MKNYSLYLELLSLRPKEYCKLLVAYAAYAKLSADLIKSNFLEAVPSTMVQLIKNLEQTGEGLELLLAVAVDQFPRQFSKSPPTVKAVKNYHRSKMRYLK